MWYIYDDFFTVSGCFRGFFKVLAETANVHVYCVRNTVRVEVGLGLGVEVGKLTTGDESSQMSKRVLNCRWLDIGHTLHNGEVQKSFKAS